MWNLKDQNFVEGEFDIAMWTSTTQTRHITCKITMFNTECNCEGTNN
jgi:hypothetical protein